MVSRTSPFRNISQPATSWKTGAKPSSSRMWPHLGGMRPSVSIPRLRMHVHWRGYQCSQGSARQPVLGVRSSDATTFCEWLTQRENGQWTYQVPVTNLNPATQESSDSIGYWITGVNGPELSVPRVLHPYHR